MRAKLIHSDLLYTASLAVFREVKNNLGKAKKHIILVPDKYTLICEKLLLEELGVNCTFDAEVMSINRFCSKVVKIEESINKQGGIILIQNILYKLNDKLKIFKNMYKQIGFAEELYATFMQIKASGVLPKDLSENKAEKELLAMKMQDIELVYGEYENFINAGNSDGLKKIEQLSIDLATSSKFNDFAFYFAFYDFFTRQEYKIIENLILKSKFVCVGASYGLGKLNEHIYSNSVYENIASIFFKYNLTEIEEVGEVLPTYFEAVKNNLFAFNGSQTKLNSDVISIYQAKNEDEEIEMVAKKIKANIVQNKMKYNQIVVALSSVDKYKLAVKNIFAIYNIPYFIDDSTLLDSTELGKFIIAILKGVAYNFMEEDLKSIIFNYFFNLSTENAEKVYKYFTLLNPNGINGIVNKTDDEVLESELISIKEKLDYINSQFKNAKFGEDFVCAIKNVLQHFNCETISEDLTKKADLTTAKLLEQVYPKITELLEQINLLSCSTEFDATSFCKVLQSGLNAYKINLVPISVDAVFVGDINSSSFERNDIYFLVGMNLSLAPKISYDLGLVTDKDIDELSSFYLIEPKISEINLRARQKLFEICLLAQTKMYVSFLLADNSGSSLKPSTLVTSLCKIFYVENEKGEKKNLSPIMIEQDLQLAYDTLNFANVAKKCQDDDFEFKKLNFTAEFLSVFDNVNKIMLKDKSCEQAMLNLQKMASNGDYATQLVELKQNMIADKSLKNAKDLFFVKGETSASQIKDFYECPYKFYLNRGVRLIEDLPYSLNKLDVGKILHTICEVFVNSIKNGSNNNIEEIKLKTINYAIKEYENLFNDSNNRFIIKNLLKEADRLMDKLYYFAKNTNFKTFATEYRFAPMKIENNFKKINLVGQIDRIDCLGSQFLVLDYKTGDSSLDFQKIYYGVKIQLLIYALAFSREKNFLNIGFGYFPIKDKYQKNENGEVSVDTINGYFDNDLEVLNNLDTTLASNNETKKESKIFNFYIKEGKTDFKTSSTTLTSQQIADLLNYVNKLMQNAVNNILNGTILVSPYEKDRYSACNSCKYSAICKKNITN